MWQAQAVSYVLLDVIEDEETERRVAIENDGYNRGWEFSITVFWIDDVQYVK